jgi:hypothetical protein
LPSITASFIARKISLMRIYEAPIIDILTNLEICKDILGGIEKKDYIA